MAASDLNNPLSPKGGGTTRIRRPILAPAVTSLAVLLALVATVWVAVVDDPDGGRAVAVAAITEAEPAATGSLAGEAGSSPVAEVTSDQATKLAALMGMPPAAGGDLSGLLEQTAFGPLPRVSPDGRRARQIYAGRAVPAVPGMPRIAIVVGGMGLSQTGTQKAIASLPEGVTLAFAPYGSSLQRWVDKARDEGHEVILQIPLEPAGYPQENPGEHTLLVSADRRARDQDLRWNLGRMTSYAGVMNYMGARFTSDERAMLPLIGEIGERGLFYLDDGSSPQSLATPVGQGLNVPVLTADRILDLKRSSAAIEQELAALEAIARVKGLAIGVASAFPQSVDLIARWATEAASRGIIIVPASAAVDS